MATKKVIKKRAVATAVKKKNIVAEGRRKKGKPMARQRKIVAQKTVSKPLKVEPELEEEEEEIVIPVPISPELIPEIRLYSDEEIGQMQLDQLSFLLPQVEALLMKKRNEIAAIEEYGQRLGDRFNQINQHWGSVFSRVKIQGVFVVDGNDGTSKRESPMKSAKISVSRTFEWALREKPPLQWGDARTRAMENALKKLVEDSEKAKAENRPLKDEILAKIESNELPEVLIGYIEKHQKLYETKRKKIVVAQDAGSQAVLAMSSAPN